MFMENKWLFLNAETIGLEIHKRKEVLADPNVIPIMQISNERKEGPIKLEDLPRRQRRFVHAFLVGWKEAKFDSKMWGEGVIEAWM